ncbi:MAG: 2-oxo acid dehydrogenase subunit E2 [Actinobacteria bacterium]|nr:2-oxo acid dehydrogenase subunit E2 [Actinomycetota bacterium]
MAAQVFSLPDVGEGLTEAEILKWHVRPGDVVAVNQVIVEIETAKASVELPCPFAGTVELLHVDEGAIVPVGSPIISITSDAVTVVDSPERRAVLVGYGVLDAGAPSRRERRAPAGAETPAATVVASPTRVVRAKPLVRKLAREKGVDIAALTASGANGEVTREDVLGAIAAEDRPNSRSTGAAGERVPVRGVQRAMAEAMVQSAFTAPHVTEWVDVDMSRSLEVLRVLREAPGNTEVRITPMILVAAGLIRAARQHPRVNSTWVDGAGGADVVIHRDVHLGIAADTPRGLLVPTIKNATSLGVVELARRVQQLIDTARAGRSTPADLTGGTITLTNVGVFGVDGGTPIITPGQSAILAMGRILDRAWVVDGQVVARPVMQLSLSFDHRVIDGALGSRVLQSVAEFLRDPALAFMLDTGWQREQPPPT